MKRTLSVPNTEGTKKASVGKKSAKAKKVAPAKKSAATKRARPAADSKTINVDFFRLEPTASYMDHGREESAKRFADGMRAIAIDHRFNELNREDDQIYLYGSIKREGALILGTLVRKQTNDIPPSFDGSITEQLPLADGQGLGYSTCFLFDPHINLVLIERPRNGVSITTFIKFLQYNFSELPKMDAATVINPADMKNFYKMDLLTRFQVRIARVENGRIFGGKGTRSVRQVAKSADKTRATMLDYTIGAPQRIGLNFKKVRSMVEGFLGFNDDEEVQVLKVTGKVDGEVGPVYPIDFIEQRLRGKITIQRHRLQFSFQAEEKKQQLLTMYEGHRLGLYDIFTRTN